MSQDETLRLAAEVVDKWSGPLASMQRSMQRMQDQLKTTHKDGTIRAREHASAFRDLQRSVHDASERVRSGLAPAMSALGLSSLSAAAGIAAVVESIKGFSGAVVSLNYLHRETGLSIDALREWDALAEHLGSSPQAMNSALRNLGLEMDRFRRGQGEMNAWFAAQQDPAMHAFANQLRAAKNMSEFLKTLEGGLDRMSFRDRIKTLQHMGLPTELGRATREERRKFLEEYRADVQKIGPEERNRAQEAEQGWERLGRAIQHLKEAIGADLAPELKTVTTELATFVAENRVGIVKVLHEIADLIKSADWKRFGQDIKATATEVNHIAQAVGGWKVVLEGLIALKAASWLLRVAGGVAQVAGALRGITALGAAPAWVLGLLGIGGGALGGAALGSIWLGKKAEELWGDRYKAPEGGMDVPGLGFVPMPSLIPPATGKPPAQHERFIGPANAGAFFQQAGFVPGGAPSTSKRDAEDIIAAGTRRGTFDALWDFFRSLGGSTAAGVTKASYEQGGGGSAGIAGALRGHGSAPGAGESGAPGGGFGGAAPARGGTGAVPGGLGVAPDGAPHGGSSGARASRGSPQQPLGAGTDIPQGRGSVAGTVASAWRAAGMSEAGVAGILGNIQQESAFNPRSRHADQPRFSGEAHFAHGLYQEGGTEWNKYAAWLQKHHPGADWRDPRLQSVFAAENLKKNYPGVWARLKAARSPEDAARIYERGYEKPAAWAANERGRMNAARRFFGHMPQSESGGLLRHALPTSPHKVTGEASLNISIAGLPRGSRIRSSASGLFREVQLNRGKAMPLASEYA